MRAREIEAYRRRLAKRTKARDLASECIGAVVAASDASGVEHVGTLTGFTVYITSGLFGPIIGVDITLCGACVGQPGNSACGDGPPITLWGSDPIRLVRNEDGARERLAA